MVLFVNLRTVESYSSITISSLSFTSTTPFGYSLPSVCKLLAKSDSLLVYQSSTANKSCFNSITLFPLGKQLHLICNIDGRKQIKQKPSTAPLISMMISMLIWNMVKIRQIAMISIMYITYIILTLFRPVYFMPNILKNRFLHTIMYQGKTEQRWTRQIASSNLTYHWSLEKYYQIVPLLEKACLLTIPYAPIQAMQQQADEPMIQAKNKIHTCLDYFLYPFSTGIKKPWIEKALPIIAANPAIPVPNAGMVAGPEGREEVTQIRKMRYPIILAIPQPIICAPKSKNFNTIHHTSRKAAFMKGLGRVNEQGGTRPYHCYTIRSKQSIKISTIPIHTQKSQKTLSTLLPLKCLSKAESRSFWSPRWMTARQQEQKLKMPVRAMTMMVNAQPACMEVSGMTSMEPPIMPLTSARMVVGRSSYL